VAAWTWLGWDGPVRDPVKSKAAPIISTITIKAPMITRLSIK
jgi:hypothetical protein